MTHIKYYKERCFILFILIIYFISPFNLFAKGKKISPEEYIQKYSPLAVKEMKRANIPASITLAQGILESGSGNSTLAKKSNNHFGIKCHATWTGEKVYHDDDEEGECFRKYALVYDSYLDHSNFLSAKGRYSFLFDLRKTDYKSWAKGLKKAGYATDPRYGSNLIQLIEKYSLYNYDKRHIKFRYEDPRGSEIVPIEELRTIADTDIDNFEIEDPEQRYVGLNNRVRYTISRQEDTFESLAKYYNLRVWQLYKFNDLREGTKLKKGAIVYIESKKNKTKGKKKYYTVKEKETLYSISQTTGVKLAKLHWKNNITPKTMVTTGMKISLKKKMKN